MQCLFDLTFEYYFFTFKYLSIFIILLICILCVLSASAMLLEFNKKIIHQKQDNCTNDDI